MLAGLALLFGVAGLGVGAAQLLFGLSTASIGVFVVTWNGFMLWVTVMSVLVWRRATRS